MLTSKSQFGLVAIALALLSAVFSLKQIHTIRIDEGTGVRSAPILGYTTASTAEADTSNTAAETAPLPFPSEEQRKKCQIVYILGVEGTMHHGVEPIIATLASHQSDESNTPYHVVSSSDDLRYGLFGYPAGHFGFYEGPPPINDPALVGRVISSICPNDNQHHVVIESTSFPSGGKHHSTSRVHRQSAWHQMTPSSIANSYSALNHPTNLYEFYSAYRYYADVKFVVLHRGFLDVIASHKNFDDGPIQHANVIMGYLILIGRFLEKHRYTTASNKDGGEKVWSMLDMDSILAKYNTDMDELSRKRHDMVYNLATFLGWTERECLDCFDVWVDSTSDAVVLLGNPNVKKLMRQMGELEGIWPPVEDM